MHYTLNALDILKSQNALKHPTVCKQSRNPSKVKGNAMQAREVGELLLLHGAPAESAAEQGPVQSLGRASQRLAALRAQNWKSLQAGQPLSHSLSPPPRSPVSPGAAVFDTAPA